MGRRRDSRTKVELGDFQTPPELAAEVCRVLAGRGVAPRSIVEPTCGTGGLLVAALDEFRGVERALGVDINDAHVQALRQRVAARGDGGRVTVEQGNFFELDWEARLAELPGPILVIGNPPWVTSADLGQLRSANLPRKSNFHGRTGIEARTGKSNFDISEWMLIRLLGWLERRDATLAMLCKSAVARKALAFGWQAGYRIGDAAMYRVDAERCFGASVDACLLVCALGAAAETAETAAAETATAAAAAAAAAMTTTAAAMTTTAAAATAARCRTYESLASERPRGVLGYQDGYLLADLEKYERWKVLAGEVPYSYRYPYQWRSGIKHDCAAVMELRREGAGYRNGAGEMVEIEDDLVYPMLKSSDVARGDAARGDVARGDVARGDVARGDVARGDAARGDAAGPTRFMLVTQRSVKEDTAWIERAAPRTWRYLVERRASFERRASSIYRGKPPFSIFGVGEYTFAPWKVAISGLYKKLALRVVGPHGGKPVVLDDTCYFLACETEAEARLLAELLASEPARELYGAFVFWDAKRPITTEILRRLDLRRLAELLGRGRELARLSRRPVAEMPAGTAEPGQLRYGPEPASAPIGVAEHG
jgi:hypothetical protein